MSQERKSSLTARVLKAVAMLGSAQAVNIVCSVVRTKLIAVWLGPAGVGLNTILVNGSNLVSTATQLNLRESAVRDLSLTMTADCQALKTAVVRRWALWLAILGAVAVIILSPLLSASAYNGSLAYTASFAALAPGIFCAAYSAGEFAVMQARDRLRQIARANVVAGVAATLIAIPLLYFLRLRSIVLIINIYAISVAVCAYLWRVKPVAVGTLSRREVWLQGRGFMVLGLSISFSALLTTLINYVLSAYINARGGESALGIYQSGYTLVNSYVGIIFSAVAVEYYPRLTRFVGRPTMARTVMTHEVSLIVRLITPFAIVFVFFADFIIRLLYSSNFEAVKPFVIFAIVGALFRGVSLCYAYRILAAGDTRTFLVTETLSAVIGLALNIVAYTFWSYAGLGVAYILWYVSYLIITAVACRCRYGVVLPVRQWVSILIATVLIFCAIGCKQYSSYESETRHTSDLQHAIDSMVTASRGVVGVALITPEGDTLTANNDQRFPLMSVFKLHESLAVAMVTDRLEQLFDSMMTVSRDELSTTTWSPMLRDYPSGDLNISVGDLVRYMLLVSDNNASNLLFDKVVSVSQTDSLMRSLALPATFELVYTEREMQADHSRSYDNWSSPLACAVLVGKVIDESLVSETKQDSIRAWLRQCSSADGRMAAAVRKIQGAKFYHRTGSGYVNECGQIIAVNDVGVIRLPDGRQIILAVLVKDYCGTQEEADAEIAAMTESIISLLL